jgi:hypothetical protein
MKRFDNTNQDIHTFSNMEPYWVDAQSNGSLLWPNDVFSLNTLYSIVYGD